MTAVLVVAVGMSALSEFSVARGMGSHQHSFSSIAMIDQQQFGLLARA